MSKSPESGATKSSLQLDEYRGKFPEIPEQDLLKIFEKYASDPESCDRMLQEESKKCLYGSSPTTDPPSPLKLLTGGRNRTDGVSPFDLPRSNSTGSAGSSHSSGRSTPVNPIPTPYVVPPRYPVATTSVPVINPAHYPTTAVLPHGAVYLINGSLYKPITSADHIPVMAYPLPAHATGSQVLPTSKSQKTSPTSISQISPNSAYPIYSTNGYFATNAPVNTAKNQSKVSSQGPGVSIPTGYFSPATQGYTTSYPVTGQFDPRYHTSPGNVPVPMISTPNMPTSTNFTPVSSASRRVQTPVTTGRNEQRPSNISTNRVPVTSTQVDPRFSTNPLGNSGHFEPLFVSTSPQKDSPGIVRKFSKSSQEELQNALSAMAVGNAQDVANDDYLRACYSRQQKRFQNLLKEFHVEKERLEIAINDISERDGALYEMKFVVEPNPTDEQLERLSAENEKLKRDINEISKNIDRLENGQAFLPPADPRLHDTHRLPSGQRHRDNTYDRSNSVPCLRQDLQGPGHHPHPPFLSRPLSEHDMNHLLDFSNGKVKYHVNPSSDTTLPDWNFINPTVPEPQATNADDETQWSCPRCTFLNHDSLSVCEMCNSSRQ